MVVKDKPGLAALKVLIDRLGSQQEAARQIGVDKSTITRWLQDRPIPPIARNTIDLLLDTVGRKGT